MSWLTSEAAVVNVTETLPAGQDYLQWLDGNSRDLAQALGAPA